MIALNLRLHILPLTRFFSSSSSPSPSLPSATLFCCSTHRNRTRVLRHFTCRAMASTEPAVSPPTVHVKDKIDLTEKEQRIFDRLVATVSHFNLPTQLRVAGGWVRDKLLGKDCYDIDIALDDMLGSKFVDKVTEYLASTGEKAQGVAVISSNPDQSKHLETARMRLYDVWIDFVNLRSEKYSEDSRIPSQMDFGTAEEDAYRRDLTINSLFYNINTSSVEDLTGRGIEDLKFGRIVTPLPPKETFLDDPLRVLRAIRFGARFMFTLDEELKRSAASDDVREALAAKISRERVGIEVDLMMSGNEPVKAANYIYELNLFSIVFGLPPNYESRLPEDCNRLCVSYLEVAWNLVQSIGSSSISNEQRRLALYAALFLPYRKENYKDNKAKKYGQIPVVNHIIRNSLKRKASNADTVIAVHKAAEGFLKLIPSLESDMDNHPNELESSIEVLDVPASSKLRVSIGFLLREIKDFWRVALLISTLLRVPDIDCSQDSSNHGYDLERRRQTYAAVESTIITLGLEKVWEVKPLVNGKQIITLLQLKNGGPVVSEWQHRVLAWQLAHPSKTADECLDWMRETQSNLSKRAKLQ